MKARQVLRSLHKRWLRRPDEDPHTDRLELKKPQQVTNFLFKYMSQYKLVSSMVPDRLEF